MGDRGEQGTLVLGQVAGREGSLIGTNPEAYFKDILREYSLKYSNNRILRNLGDSLGVNFASAGFMSTLYSFFSVFCKESDSVISFLI